MRAFVLTVALLSLMPISADASRFGHMLRRLKDVCDPADVQCWIASDRLIEKNATWGCRADAGLELVGGAQAALQGGTIPSAGATADLSIEVQGRCYTDVSESRQEMWVYAGTVPSVEQCFDWNGCTIADCGNTPTKSCKDIKTCYVDGIFMCLGYEDDPDDDDDGTP